VPLSPSSLPFARRLLPLSLAAALLAVPAMYAMAAAASDAPRSFRIAAAPSGQALRQFAGQAGILLSAEGGLTQGKRSAGLNATVAIGQGLQQLLAGTGGGRPWPTAAASSAWRRRPCAPPRWGRGGPAGAGARHGDGRGRRWLPPRQLDGRQPP
jgi:hypothetical protein